MTVIPGLPPHLASIPPAPLSPDDPEADAKRRAWRAWRYQVHRYRVERHILLTREPDLRPIEVQLCANHPAYFAAMWLRVFEPRWRVETSLAIPDGEADDPDAESVPTTPMIVTGKYRKDMEGGEYDPETAPLFGWMPFVPFADQVTVMNRLLWTLHQTDENADAVWSKCRGWGASWIGCLLAVWGWNFSHRWVGAPPWNVLLLSRKMEYVDSKQQKSLFWKVRRLMRDMPDWMMPAGWNPDINDNIGILTNPENGNQLNGESTNADAGRGDRVTWAWLDEAAKMPLDEIWGTVTETTDHRWAVSTESLEDGPDFYNLRTGTDMEFRPHLIESDWWQNPLNDDLWYERQKRRYAQNPAVFAREILRDPHAGSDTLVYPRAWDPEHAPDPAIGVDTMAPTFVSCDPGQLDETALLVIQEDVATGNWNVLDAYQNKGVEAAFYGTILAAQPDEARFPRMYGERELAFMELIQQIPAPTYVGDTYGDTSNGVTMDTFYTVLSRFRDPHNQPIMFNRDRIGQKDLSMYMEQSRSFKGRREALQERVPLLRFSTRPGAQFALRCLKNNQYKPESVGTLTEAKVPKHDWTSHIVQAFEFWAVYQRTRSQALRHTVKAPSFATVGYRTKHAKGVATASLVKRQKARLYQVR